jgi:hypothetical protein
MDGGVFRAVCGYDHVCKLKVDQVSITERQTRKETYRQRSLHPVSLTYGARKSVSHSLHTIEGEYAEWPS